MRLDDLKRLAMFVTVVDQGGFAAAARKLGMSRSSISEQIALLESALDTRLLNRTTRQVNLTSEGMSVYERAQGLNDIYADIQDLADQERPQGRVRLTATHNYTERWLIPRLKRFSKLYPDITFDLIPNDAEMDLIAENIDIAVRIGRPKDSSLIARPITEEAPVIVASESYVERYGKPDSVEDLANHTWVLLAQISMGNRVSLTGPNGITEFVPNHYHRTNAPLAAQAMINQGMGIGLHLRSLISDDLSEHRLQMLLPDWHGERLTFSLVYPSRRNLPLRTRVLIDYLLDA